MELKMAARIPSNQNVAPVLDELNVSRSEASKPALDASHAALDARHATTHLQALRRKGHQMLCLSTVQQGRQLHSRRETEGSGLDEQAQQSASPTDLLRQR